MKITVVSHGLSFTPKMKVWAERKITKIAKLLKTKQFLKEALEVQVGVSRHPVKFYQVTLTLLLPNRRFRAETAGDNFRFILTQAVAILERQIQKYKSKIKKEPSFRKVADKKRLG